MVQGQNGNIAEINEDIGKTSSPPYISFLTFENFLTWLEGEGIPLKFDRSFWGKKFAGSTGSQLMAGLRFLGLLNGDEPQPILEEIVKAKGEDRRDLLVSLFQHAYSLVDFPGLERATPKMLSEWLGSYKIDGSTLRKAESFFINACKTYNIALSNSLKKKARNKPVKSTLGTKKNEKSKGELPTNKDQQDETNKNHGEQRQEQVNKLTLASGGEVRLSINVDLFQLSKEDRDFVITLIDSMKGYGNKIKK